MRTNEADGKLATLIAMPNIPVVAPAVPDSYDAVRFNALRHGILSRYTVLSHENADDYQSLLSALAEDHRPAGAKIGRAHV